MFNKNLSSLQRANYQIKIASIFAYISASATFIFAFIVDSLLIIDAIVTLILALLFHKKKSRIAASLLLFLYLLPRLLDPSLINSTNLLLTGFYIAIYIAGIIGVFSYHKLQDNQKDNLKQE